MNWCKYIHTEDIVGAGLVIALLLAIIFEQNEIAMSIGSGLVGYIGRGKLQKGDN